MLLAGATVLAGAPVALRCAVGAETGTVKSVTIVSRSGGNTSEQLVERLKVEYAPLANRLPEQRGLIISGVVKRSPATM